MRFTAADAAHALNASLSGLRSELDDVVCDGVSYDSRTLSPGQLFVAVRGDRDGHEFIADAHSRGASAAMVDHQVDVSIPQIIVDDTVVALGELAVWSRHNLLPKLHDRVVGITGSVGKTSMKDFVRSALAMHYPVVSASSKSLNNDIGLPVTMLNAPEDTDVLVLEMGMRGLHEIKRLCDVAHPSVGVITKIGLAHTERVGGIEGVVRAKSELFESLPATGVAIVNKDDPYANDLMRHANCRVRTFGFDSSADVQGRVIVVDNAGRVKMRVQCDGMSAELTVPVPGVHMATNALGAVAVATTLGVPFHSALHGITEAHLSSDRMHWQPTSSGARLLNDAYNANPTSTEAAIRTLAQVPAARRIAVLGVMAELEDAETHHRHVASIAEEAGIEIIAVDTVLYGVPSCSLQDAVSRLSALGDDHVILVKGSRVAGLERLVRQLT
jgi:UDP-N-acetylmuramoyl-tripeptide--D-alanyl-D-alanine ligase